MESYIDHDAPSTGWGEGTYVEDTARDRGFSPEPPATLLPELLNGARPFSRRALRMGRQAAADRITEPQNDTENTEGRVARR
jgi:hypothetical protein